MEHSFQASGGTSSLNTIYTSQARSLIGLAVVTCPSLDQSLWLGLGYCDWQPLQGHKAQGKTLQSPEQKKGRGQGKSMDVFSSYCVTITVLN